MREISARRPWRRASTPVRAAAPWAVHAVAVAFSLSCCEPTCVFASTPFILVAELPVERVDTPVAVVEALLRQQHAEA